MQSHPMWVRGLKLGTGDDLIELLGVAPHVGAWIETNGNGDYLGAYAVAPHVGAWIETVY